MTERVEQAEKLTDAELGALRLNALGRNRPHLVRRLVAELRAERAETVRLRAALEAALAVIARAALTESEG